MQTDKTTLKANIEADIPDNTTRLVSPADIRDNLIDLVDSVAVLSGSFSNGDLLKYDESSDSFIPKNDLTALLDGKQNAHANLTAFAGLGLVTDRLPYANGSGSLALATFTAFARMLLDDASASAARTTLGLSTTHDVEFRSLTVNSNKGISIEINGGLVMDSQHSGTGTFKLDELEANRTYIFPDKSGNVALTSDLANYQPIDASLTALSDLTGSANQMPMFTGDDSMTLVPTAAIGRKLLQLGQSTFPIFGIPVVSGPSDHNFAEACTFGGGLELVLRDPESPSLGAKLTTNFGPFLYKHPDGHMEFINSAEPTAASRGEKFLELCASLETNAGLMVMQDCTLSEPISFPANKPSNIICTADIYFSSAVDYFADLSNGQRVYILNAGDWVSQKTSGVSKGFRVSHAASLLAFSSMGGAGSVMCRGGSNQASMAVEVTDGTAYLLGGTYGSLASGGNPKSVVRSGGTVVLSPLSYCPNGITGTVNWQPMFNGDPTNLMQLATGTVPTSDPGVAGRVWCDTANGYVVKLSAG